MRKRTFSLFGMIFVATLLIFSLGSMALAQGIKVLDPSYKVETLIKPTPLRGCNGITVGIDGALYVAQVSAMTISRIDLKTMKVSTFVPPYAGVYIPDDIATDDKGNFYVTGTTPFVGEVYRIDSKGRKTVIARGLKAPNGVEYDKRHGRLFITECFQGNRVFELDPTGKKPPRLLIKENVIPVPEGFGFDEAGNLIIPDLGTGKILRVHPDSGAIATIAEGFVTPVALDVGPEGEIYVVELATGNVYRLSMDGSKREKLAQILPGLDNVAITKDGRVFVTSYHDATVFEVSTDGSGKYKALFPMGMNMPNGVVVKGDGILISDAVEIWSVKGKGQLSKTKLNAWLHHGMPLPLGLTDGPAGQVFWSDWVNGAVAIGNPKTGEFKPIAKLTTPMGMMMGTDGRLYVAEYLADRISAVSLKDGSKTVVAEGLAGPLCLTIKGQNIYVAEAKAGRISRVEVTSGTKEVFLSGIIGKPVAISQDDRGNLLVLDGGAQKLYRIGTEDLSISLVAEGLPVNYGIAAPYPPVEVPYAMGVGPNGDVYLANGDGSVIALKKARN